mmetsp:Transcript_36073/g.87201  ORF Transcript_36073/g.87201 Transcript_36073/m.87201 type:complete len:84 (-) Transcript_36073:400-651(-)
MNAKRNLLSNAIKFTPPNGTITVKASWRRPPESGKKRRTKSFKVRHGESVSYPENGDVCLMVQDSGVGMDQDELNKLFGEGVQ